jgi:acyl-CoA thioesterase II
VDPALLLHSLHCYFLSFGDVQYPVLYMIERARDGRSYATRTVKAVQKGKEIFVLIASFQRPEPEQPRFQIDVKQHEVFRSIAPPEVGLSRFFSLLGDLFIVTGLKQSILAVHYAGMSTYRREYAESGRSRP